MARKRRIRWDRVALVFAPLIILIVFLCVQCGKSGTQPEENSRGKATLEGTVPSLEASALPAELEKTDFKIVVDAGHGGEDGGCTDLDGTRLEKDDNLRLALLVRDHLKTHSGVTVIMTREDDTFISLKERCRIANDADADLFVSLHRNAASNANGVEIWINSDSVANDNSVDYRMAGYIRSWLNDVGVSQDRGIRSGFRNSENSTKEDNYAVNRDTKMPSCLVEMGFMTSDTDNRNFDNRLNEYADAIASALIEMGEDTGMYVEKKPQ